MLKRFIILVTSLSLRPLWVEAQQPVLQVEHLMTAAEYRQAGLRKLSPEEIAALNLWLTKFARAAIQASAPPAAPDTTPAVIESRVDGDFSGWEGETIFRLQNGQVWQQSSYAYYYHYAYAPKVLIYKSVAGYAMRVDGTDRAIAVKRLR